MDELIYLQTDHVTMRKLLGELKGELQQFATRDAIDLEVVEVVKGYISNVILPCHFIKEEDVLATFDQKRCGEIIDQIRRLHGLAKRYFMHFSHYWKCYEEGISLARYDVVSYGESCITAILESMKLEEKLFSLTKRDCIVQ